MECPKCGEWMVDPRGGMGSWVYHVYADGKSGLHHRSHHDYQCPKCGHREHVDREEWIGNKPEVHFNKTSEGSEDN
ncbi:MAG: hypothetical protein LCI00_16985 [Chloroflexi bacterium]|nr:hypothetical protein [Chloroflexota bacterium]